MESKEIEEIGKIVSDSISDTLFSILDFIQETKPFIFYRKIKFKKKIKRIYMIRVNPVKSLLADNLIYGLNFGKRLLELLFRKGVLRWKKIKLVLSKKEC